MFVSLAGCGAIGSTITFHNSDKWLPGKFHPAKTVLLVEVVPKPKSGATKEMKVYLAKHYPYKYEVVTMDEIKDVKGKYSDLNTYPYALVWSLHGVYVTDYDHFTHHMTKEMVGKGYDMNFYERETGHDYPKTTKGCTNPRLLFNPVINTIVKYCHKG